jgi:Transposase DDE domain
VVRHGAKYYATNRLTLPAAEVRRLYGVRARIEEVIRVCKDQLGLTGCQAHSDRAQQHHMACCLVAFCVLARERHDRHLSIYKLKRQLSFETITKWGLCSFLLLTHTRLHPRIPATTCCLQVLIEDLSAHLQQEMRAALRPPHLLLLDHPSADDRIDRRFSERCRDRLAVARPVTVELIDFHIG